MPLRCLWQMQQRHWCAAVGKIEEQRKPEDFSGHRKPDSSSTAETASILSPLNRAGFLLWYKKVGDDDHIVPFTVLCGLPRLRWGLAMTGGGNGMRGGPSGGRSLQGERCLAAGPRPRPTIWVVGAIHESPFWTGLPVGPAEV